MNLTLSNLIGTLKTTFKVGTNATIDASLATTPRTYQLPDKNGVLATMADVGAGAGAGSISIPFFKANGTQDDIVILAGTLAYGVATLTFPTRGTYATVTVANTLVQSTSRFRLIVASDSTPDHSMEEHAIEDLSFGITSLIPNTSFTIAGICKTGTTHGAFKVYWEYV
jgi:hypothetical protein